MVYFQMKAIMDSWLISKVGIVAQRVTRQFGEREKELDPAEGRICCVCGYCPDSRTPPEKCPNCGSGSEGFKTLD